MCLNIYHSIMDQIHYTKSPHRAINLIDADYHQFEFNRHYHLDFHIGLIASGAQSFRYKGSQHCVGHGEVVIMHPDELHDGRSLFDSGYQVKVFCIQPEWFQEHLELDKACDVIAFKQLIIQNPDTFAALTQLHNKLAQSDLSQLAKDCLPYEGLSELVKNYSSMQENAPVPLGSQSLQTLKEYLWANLDLSVHLNDLAELCHLSPTQLQRNFKAKTGMTPYAWLSRLRLEKAMQLIKAGVTGTEVAHRVGFYDQAHFSKAFRHSFGVSPSAIN